MNKLYKSDLIHLAWSRCRPLLFYQRTNLEVAEKIINVFLDVLKENITDYNKIEIQKLLTFTPITRKATRAYSFKENKVVDREDRVGVKVDLAREIKERIRKHRGTP